FVDRAEARQNRPGLVINKADLPETARELGRYLLAHNKFFDNGTFYVAIVVKDGMLCAITATPDMVRVAAHDVCEPVTIDDKGNLTKVTLSTDVADLWFALPERQGNVLRGITTSPILSDDGSIRVEQGYDPETKLWCHNVPDIEVPPNPTEQDAREALQRVRFFFRTFPFADAERVQDGDLEIVDWQKPPALDESTFLAVLLTAVTRQCLKLAPGALFNAPNVTGAGTGKGLLIRAIAIVASGVPPTAFTFGHDSEEFDKRLTAALVEARP